jgi:hypothetical protein
VGDGAGVEAGEEVHLAGEVVLVGVFVEGPAVVGAGVDAGGGPAVLVAAGPAAFFAVLAVGLKGGAEGEDGVEAVLEEEVQAVVFAGAPDLRAVGGKVADAAP